LLDVCGYRLALTRHLRMRCSTDEQLGGGQVETPPGGHHQIGAHDTGAEDGLAEADGEGLGAGAER
jgi:hypothetical protein